MFDVIYETMYNDNIYFSLYKRRCIIKMFDVIIQDDIYHVIRQDV